MRMTWSVPAIVSIEAETILSSEKPRKAMAQIPSLRIYPADPM